MNTCGTCKHLGTEIREWDREERKVVPSGYFECGLLTLARKEGRGPAVLAYAQDGSEYVAVLCVRNEFGCAEWRPVTQFADRSETK